MIVILVRAVLWALPGALLGLFFAAATLAAVRWGVSAGADQVASVAFGPSVIGAGLALTLLAGLATGGVAAWTLRRRNLVDALREGGQTTSGGRAEPQGDVRARRAAGRGGHGPDVRRRAARAQHVERRVGGPRVRHREGLLRPGPPAAVEVPESAANGDYFRRAIARLRALPGVVSAGVSISPPLTDTSVMLSGGLEVTTPAGKEALDRLNGQFVTPGYFESIGMRLVRGRFFSAADEQAKAAGGCS